MSATTLSHSSSPLPHQLSNKTTTKSSASPLLVASQKKKTMSITQTYYLAHQARAKLSHEAARADHDLRLLVGHANLLDSLMLELADAEREQESWFNQSVRKSQQEEEQKQQQAKTSELKKERHIQWADTIVEDPEEEEDDWHVDDLDTDSESEVDSDEDEEDDTEMVDSAPLRRVPSATPTKYTALLSVEEDDDDMEEDDLEEDYAQLELVRTHSRSSGSPPELAHDSEDSDESEDDSMPPSPPNAILSFPEKDAKEQSKDFYSEGFYLPRRNQGRLVSAISVY